LKIKHFYKSIHGWCDFEDIYKEQVEIASDGSHFVEVGTYQGQSAAYMAVEIANSEKQIQFDCIDKWKWCWSGIEKADEDDDSKKIKGDAIYSNFLLNIFPVRDYINPIKEWSADAAPLYEDKSVDFVFIDARHTYDMVTLDIQSWLPKVKDGGVLAGHDYFDKFPEVIQAVDDYFGDSISVRGNSWIYQN
jgi:hypothetical protein